MQNDSIATEVVEACLLAGIREYVVCAGARNLSLIESLVSSEEAVVWSHFEERSAGFFALGRTMDSGEPCAVVTTSGTAVAELLPALVEAHYQRRPLVIISADRPQCYRGSGSPQAIEQVGIFSHYVEGVDDIEALGGEYFQEWSGRGTWQLNVCLEENAVSRPVGKLLGEPKLSRENFEVSSLVHFFENFWQGMVVCVGALEPEDREEVFGFLSEIRVPVIADPTSGLRELLGPLLVADPERLLKAYAPRLVLRIGEVPIGRFWRDLEDAQDVEVMSIARNGLPGLVRQSSVIRGEVGRILRGLGEVGELGDSLDMLKGCRRRWAQIDQLLEMYPDSEPGMVRTLSLYSSVAQSLYLGNSLPIREWGQFGQREYPVENIRANRGANGIDGQLSTWIGLTHGIEDAWCVLGDLTTLYDMSAPILLEECEAPGRVLVVINNGGGAIFSRLDRVGRMSSVTQSVVTNEHSFSFEAWAKLWGWDYQLHDSANDIEIEGRERPLVVEVRPDKQQTEAFWKAYGALEL
ncbi:2-succinyl-5-enolpyruvyl-6-hydroxy-3-cyclohexene-1-carboxylic-acid synthase [Rubritalea tangerina]|uniref:2-succinyl-5-enolpyruvyl-6-hydroxy-3-cyclohexene-1-carboxylic-acid synthase n=1 Tax=Rubritalea tangerina TaxID=430798 RepID=A0ABW4Z5Z5_9BACT